MSSLASDIVIVVLLFGGILFGGISLLGLLIFPDIRSRLFTALRGGLLCAGAICGAALIYALTLLAESGGEQYATFFFHAIFLAGIMILGIMIINRQMQEKTRAIAYCGAAASVPEQQKTQ